MVSSRGARMLAGWTLAAALCLATPARAQIGEEIITTPQYRHAPFSPFATERLETAQAIGVWALEGGACTITLAADSEIRVGERCAAPWPRAARWRLFHSRAGTTALQVFDRAGARVWSGLLRRDGAFLSRQGETVRRIDDPAPNP